MAARAGQEPADDLPGGHELSDEIRELVATLRTSNVAWEAMATATDRDRRNRNRWFAGLAGGLLVVLGAVALVLVNQSASTSRGLTIKDCTVPGGQCYQQQQVQRQEDTKANLLLSLAVADCSSQGNRGSALRTCVEVQLSATGVTLPTGSKP